MKLRRDPRNPVIRPLDVPPSRPDFEVVGAFNAGAVQVGDETLLLLRVAERPREADPSVVVVPYLKPDGEVELLRLRRDSPDVNASDSRSVVYRGEVYLSSLSHLRIARSRDGVHFRVDPTPTLWPSGPYERYGVEDPRVTPLEGRYLITYTAVSDKGVAVALAATSDFHTFERLGLILPPENKNAALFPGMAGGPGLEAVGGLSPGGGPVAAGGGVGGGVDSAGGHGTPGGHGAGGGHGTAGRRYLMLHRPASPGLGKPGIWLAYSPDLRHWGDHRHLLGVRPGRWDALRVGAGAVPLQTPRGWLVIYHGVRHEDGRDQYCLGAALLDLEQPHVVLARSPEPILVPEEAYERLGFYGNVVFSCGAIADPGGRLRLYYGVADQSMALAVTTVDELIDSLEPERVRVS